MSTSHLWALIEEWRDAQLFPVSQAALADKVGVTRSAMSQWKKGQATPAPENLRSLSRVTRIQYERLLAAVVRDMGYMSDEEVVGNAEHPAPMNEAGETPAADDSNVHEFRGRLVSRETWDEDAATFSERAVANEDETLEEEGIAQLKDP